MSKKLYAIDVAIYATAYVKAESALEATKKLEFRGPSYLEVTPDAPAGFICDLLYRDIMSSDDEGYDITFSPMMTIDHLPNDEATLVWPEEEDDV